VVLLYFTLVLLEEMKRKKDRVDDDFTLVLQLKKELLQEVRFYCFKSKLKLTMLMKQQESNSISW
jgi:hypothetical protein